MILLWYKSFDIFCVADLIFKSFEKIKKKMKKVNVIEDDDEASVSYTKDLSGGD